MTIGRQGDRAGGPDKRANNNIRETQALLRGVTSTGPPCCARRIGHGVAARLTAHPADVV